MNNSVDNIHMQAQELRALRKLLAAYEQVLKQYGLTATDWLLFEALVIEPEGVTMSACARAAHVRLPLITRLVKSHETARLVSIATDPDDKRVRTVALTQRGTSVYKEVTEALETMRTDMHIAHSIRQQQAHQRFITSILKAKTPEVP